MNRRSFLRTATGSAALISGSRMWGATVKPSKPSNEDLLAQCDDRIARHRQTDGIIRVLDRQRKPIPGAVIKVAQSRHEFLFGCNIFRFGRYSHPDREEQYRQRFTELLNYATLGFYWGSYEREQGQPSYAYTDSVLDWCEQQGILCKGHPLAWDHPASSPRWLPNDIKEVERLSTARVRDCIDHFKGRIQMWDVVNEPTDLTRFKNPMNDFARSLGAVPYTRLHLEVARQANPQAAYLVNDYRSDPGFYKILDALRQEGKLIFDTVGIQSHMHSGVWPLPKIWEVCDRFAKLDLPIHFTETTVVSGASGWEKSQPWPGTAAGEAQQAEYVPQFYTMLFAHPGVQAITWWDFSDDGAWQGAPAGFLRKDMSPKPAYERLMSLIKGMWWTQTAGRTNDKGEYSVRAFFGTHQVTTQLPNGQTLSQEVRWSRGSTNQLEIVAG